MFTYFTLYIYIKTVNDCITFFVDLVCATGVIWILTYTYLFTVIVTFRWMLLELKEVGAKGLFHIEVILQFRISQKSDNSVLQILRLIRWVCQNNSVNTNNNSLLTTYSTTYGIMLMYVCALLFIIIILFYSE